MEEQHAGNLLDKRYLVFYGAALLLSGEESKGREILEIALHANLEPLWISRAHNWLGYRQLMLGESDFGENHFLEALQSNPKSPESRFNLGRSYLKQKKFAQSLDYFQLAELEAPQLWLIHLYKGRARAELKQSLEARSAFQSAISASPDRWLPYLYFALFQMETRNLIGAEENLNKMLTRDPSYELLHPAPFGFYQESVNYNDYRAAIREIFRRRGSSEMRELGRIYLSILNKDLNPKDHKSLEQTASKGPTLARIVNLYSILDENESKEKLSEAAMLLPTNLEELGAFAYALRGEANHRSGNLLEAKADFENGLRLEPTNARVRMDLIRLLLELKDNALAQEHLQKLLDYHPLYIPAVVLAKQ